MGWEGLFYSQQLAQMCMVRVGDLVFDGHGCFTVGISGEHVEVESVDPARPRPGGSGWLAIWRMPVLYGCRLRRVGALLSQADPGDADHQPDKREISRVGRQPTSARPVLGQVRRGSSKTLNGNVSLA